MIMQYSIRLCEVMLYERRIGTSSFEGFMPRHTQFIVADDGFHCPTFTIRSSRHILKFVASISSSIVISEMARCGSIDISQRQLRAVPAQACAATKPDFHSRLNRPRELAVLSLCTG